MDKDINKKRSTLTLKLGSSSGASDPKKLALKTAENKRISNSMVQVTIKGRKPKAVIPDSKNLSQQEFDNRKEALSNAGNKSEALEDRDGNIFNKITEDIVDKKEVTEPVVEEVLVQEVATPELEEEVAVKEESKVEEYNVDSFDVRNKIKSSLAIDNQKKEERDRIAQSRKKAEQDEIEKVKEKEKKIVKSKKPHKEDKFDDSFNQNDKKGKPSFKDRKVNSRRLLQTFIVDGDVDNYGNRHKKQKQKLKAVDANQKDRAKITKEVILPELIIVSDLADRMAEKTGDVVKKLFMMGLVATSNQVIDADTAELIIEEFGHKVKRVQASDVESVLEIEEDNGFEKLDRAPIVTIMGHVDHGKTSLLDAIKSTDVVGGESGGITQHIGASRIKTASGKYITFLDTPGHEAFTEMRSRGANVTDIVVLVVAADDGVKEQTIEAINHAKAANVPIIVAVNKIDKPGADPARVKNELLAHEIVSEDLGGDVMFVEVSAKQKLNLDGLEDIILLQAELLELKASYANKAKGLVVETRVDHSQGVVATLLIQSGTLNISDIVVAGTSYGKIKKMTDDKGKNIKTATPSMPVEILGLDAAPNAGDQFSVVQEEKQARDIIAYRSKKERDAKSLQNTARSISDIFREAGKEGMKYLPIIIKGDVHGSVEAIAGSLMKLNTKEVGIKVIHSATGGINESDISLASVSGSIIIGFNVRSNSTAKDLALEKNIDIRYHSIIYNVVDEMKLLLGGMLEPVKNEETLGQAEIRQVFKVSSSGKIAGCFVTSGVIKRGAKVRLLRENVVIYDGELKTLKRFKDDVKEVKHNFECGVAFENYDDMKELDIIECYEIVEQKRTLDMSRKRDKEMEKEKGKEKDSKDLAA